MQDGNGNITNPQSIKIQKIHCLALIFLRSASKESRRMPAHHKKRLPEYKQFHCIAMAIFNKDCTDSKISL